MTYVIMLLLFRPLFYSCSSEFQWSDDWNGDRIFGMKPRLASSQNCNFLTYNIGALVIRVGYCIGARYTMILIGNPHNSIGNYLGPYITSTC